VYCFKRSFNLVKYNVNVVLIVMQNVIGIRKKTVCSVDQGHQIV
jgi:hypothetical protein